jgi:hypothetical protein
MLVKKLIYLLLTSFLLFSCNRFAPFHHGPINIDVPDGPPQFKAGYYDGCRSALSIRKMKNAASVYSVKSNGIYTDDEVYQSAWGNGWFTCYISSGTWTKFHPFSNSPLAK